MNTPTPIRAASRPGPWAALVLSAAALLAGCETLKSFTCEVSTYGTWPSGRVPGSFAIDRLPSQDPTLPEQRLLEDAASASLRGAGFTPAGDAATADVVVQVGARVSRTARSPWDDPLWWQFGVGRWNWPRFGSSHWGGGVVYARVDYEREAALLIRDRASGQPLYEARARSDGVTSGGNAVIQGLFAASLKGFPAVQPEPHDVTVTLP